MKKSEYQNLCEAVQDLIKCQYYIQQNLECRENFWLELYNQIKYYVTKQRKQSLNELFWIQNENLKYVNSILENIVTNSRKELNELEVYYDSIEYNLKTSEQKIKQLKQRPNNLHNVRQKQEYLHTLQLRQEKILELETEKQFVAELENVLRNTVQITECMYQKTLGMQTHIQNTIKAIRRIDNQTEHNEIIYSAITVSNDFILALHESLKLPEFQKIIPTDYRNEQMLKINEKIEELKKNQRRNLRNLNARFDAEKEIRKSRGLGV